MAEYCLTPHSTVPVFLQLYDRYEWIMIHAWEVQKINKKINYVQWIVFEWKLKGVEEHLSEHRFGLDLA